MRYFSLITAFFFLVNLSTAIAEVDPWYEQNPSCVIDRGNPARTGEYKTEPLEKFHKIIWKKEVKGRLTPLCFNNFIIIAGPAVWNFAKNQQVWGENNKYNLTGFTLYKNILYSTFLSSSNLHNLIGYDVKTGTIIFKESFGKNNAVSLSPLIYNDIIYLPLNETLLAYSLTDKTILWQVPFNISNQLSTDGQNLYTYRFDTKSTVAINLKTGKESWSSPIEPNGYISLYKGKAFIASCEKINDQVLGKVYALNAKTGKVFWSFVLSSCTNMPNLAITNDKVFALDYKKLHALDINTGKELWYFPQKLREFPSIAGNTVYVRSAELIYAIDSETGKLKSKYPIKTLNYYDGMLGSIVPYQRQLLLNSAFIHSDRVIVVN